MIRKDASRLEKVVELQRPVASLRGIGPKRAGFLAQKGIHTVLDLLLFTPIRYEDRNHILSMGEAEEGVSAWFRGKVLVGREERFAGRRLFRIVMGDGTGFLHLLWFQYKRPPMESLSRPGSELMAYGVVRRNRNQKQVIHPDVASPGQADEEGLLSVHPFYSKVEGVSSKVLRTAVKETLGPCADAVTDVIPAEITRRLGLPPLGEAIRSLHLPPGTASVEELNVRRTTWHQRLIFERFFEVMLNVSLRRRSRKERAGPLFRLPADFSERAESLLPFSLTKDQAEVIEDISKDVGSGRAMNRLIQGDVGCGKTVVAAVAAHMASLNLWQTAVMVPTQVLARQHFNTFSSLAQGMGFRPVLLTGALTGGERTSAAERIRKGDYNVIIGTQSLIQRDLSFHRLGLVVIDEQHRFGVRERSMLDEKGPSPHLIVMTATPIPRTLAITLYADMDISLIKRHPAGHRPVETRLVPGSEKRAVFQEVKRRMSAGQQALVICPVIEGSGEADLKSALEMYGKLKKIYGPPFRVGLIHGGLPPEEKERVMDLFERGGIDLLVGTTVVEVGVHAPGATVMVVEHPERYGLAQLHQLRGRVGRGSERGLCLLMKPGELGESALSRLKVLVSCHDGFEIARKDLAARGQGQLMGVRQAGRGELDMTEVLREPELLFAARKEAEKLLEGDPGLSRPENRLLKQLLEPTWTRPLSL
jgi:ATP-dependent DNA helicase RecG